jgi:hypothetical protein
VFAKACIFDAGGQWFEIDRVLPHRLAQDGRRAVTQYLVKWKGYGDKYKEWRVDEVGVTAADADA